VTEYIFFFSYLFCDYEIHCPSHHPICSTPLIPRDFSSFSAFDFPLHPINFPPASNGPISKVTPSWILPPFSKNPCLPSPTYFLSLTAQQKKPTEKSYLTPLPVLRPKRFKLAGSSARISSSCSSPKLPFSLSHSENKCSYSSPLFFPTFESPAVQGPIPSLRVPPQRHTQLDKFVLNT